MLIMGCHCSWQHPRLTILRKYYWTSLHLTSNQSHPKSQRGANEETSSQFEVWGPTDGSRLVAWEELTLLPAPSFSPQRTTAPPPQLLNKTGGRVGKSERPGCHPAIVASVGRSDYIWGRRRTWTRRAIHGSCGIRFWGATWETSLMLHPETNLRPFWTISLI